ncbi:hypothetical protein ALC53_01807 [Atta colombica]|uniref:Uncharacterized protein n=1 Tax=Atta colombica TaxID=520822 RepID=A0A151I5T0_9HYME|nr:hypothetical protein ALC53_01807 [Atta colombica]
MYRRHPCINHQFVVTHSRHATVLCSLEDCRGHPQSLKPLTSSSASLRSRDERPAVDNNAHYLHGQVHHQNARSDLARPRAKAPRDSAPRDPRMTRAIAIQTFGSPFSRGSIIDHWNFCRGEVVPSVAPVSGTPRGSPLIPVKRELKTCATQRSESPSQRSDSQGPLTRNDADAGVI